MRKHSNERVASKFGFIQFLYHVYLLIITNSSVYIFIYVYIYCPILLYLFCYIKEDVMKLIKKVTAPCMTPSLSLRGLRVGGSTKMAMNKDISNEEQRQALGHSGGKSTEIYVRMNPNLGIPASLCLAEWDDVRLIPFPPTLDALNLTEEEINILLDKLYIISLEEYKTLGIMRVLLHHCTASLIMYYPMYIDDYDDRMKLPMKLIRVIRQCNFAVDDALAKQILMKWSDAIRNKFVTVNNLVKTCDDKATQATMMQIMNNQSVLFEQTHSR